MKVRTKIGKEEVKKFIESYVRKREKKERVRRCTEGFIGCVILT